MGEEDVIFFERVADRFKHNIHVLVYEICPNGVTIARANEVISTSRHGARALIASLQRAVDLPYSGKPAPGRGK